MQRIQYHRYGGPEEMRLETYELPALGEYVHDPRAGTGRPEVCGGAKNDAIDPKARSLQEPVSIRKSNIKIEFT